jgi:hypothetical protein
MNGFTCPVGRPVGAENSVRFAWSEAVLNWTSAATFTPTRWAK